ncbi:transporter [Sinirhodobacter ferrireducens]|uniref:Transporter n=1 Tax=Paenirhodobacter ferrireducens TaxID=1215032 RepID=A0A443L852_9RHOB|nr:transporter [Sinirhodobacter ferrireducens]RWR45370.1 transporter [Sinirhodobacter ferrireducens]
MKMTQILGAGAVALALAALPARAIDVGPADYTILPSGTALAMLYLQHLSADSLEVNGTAVPGSSFEANVGILRGLYYTAFGDLPAAYHLVIPFADIDRARIGGADQPASSGLGDTTLGLTVWPVQPKTPETGTSFGVSLFATLPTGNYNPERLGIGEGTWSLTPQIGVIQGLGGGFFFDGALDVAFQGDHREAGAEHSRSPSWQLQAMLRKQWGPATSLTVGYSGQRGGKQKVAGAETGLKTHRDQLRLYLTHFIDPTTQIQGLLARDFNVEGGYKYDSAVQLRLVKVF